jgi:hypothetical protein
MNPRSGLACGLLRAPTGVAWEAQRVRRAIWPRYGDETRGTGLTGCSARIPWPSRGGTPTTPRCRTEGQIRSRQRPACLRSKGWWGRSLRRPKGSGAPLSITASTGSPAISPALHASRRGMRRASVFPTRRRWPETRSSVTPIELALLTLNGVRSTERREQPSGRPRLALGLATKRHPRGGLYGEVPVGPRRCGDRPFEPTELRGQNPGSSGGRLRATASGSDSTRTGRLGTGSRGEVLATAG